MKIILAVTGGIAAYKSAELVRQLIKKGAEVQVVMTEGAQAFVTPLTFQALSGRAVRTSLLDEAAELGMGHIELAKWADQLVIAPASADVLAKLAAGAAGDLLSTVVLAYQGRVSIAPAMNQAMWLNPVTQSNVKKLQSLYPAWQWIGPDSGDQACGDIGPGRMSEPEEIVRSVFEVAAQPLVGKKVVITAGPTLERIDPVRYISNFSSGKMGYALASAARKAGANVVLVSGPVSLDAPSEVECVRVESARQMLEAVENSLSSADLFIATAAVADYAPDSIANHKIKKDQGNELLELKLAQNPDILATVASMPAEQRPFVVGFAAETEQVEHFAREKLLKKNLDLIVANDVSGSETGFGSDRNQVSLISHHETLRYGPDDKTRVADWLISQVSAAMESNK